MELTESHILHSIDQLIQNKVMLNVGWIGPFMALVGCFRPETIKLVLKGQCKVNSLFLNVSIIASIYQ